MSKKRPIEDDFSGEAWAIGILIAFLLGSCCLSVAHYNEQVPEITCEGPGCGK